MLEEEAFELAIWKKRISGVIPKLLRYESEINNRQKGTDKLRGFVGELELYTMKYTRWGPGYTMSILLPAKGL